MLDRIKILLGLLGDDKDELITTLIAMARDEAVQYCNLLEYSTKLDTAVTNMVIERYNRLGTEGVSSVSTNGVAEDYVNGYSRTITNLLNRQRKVRML